MKIWFLGTQSPNMHEGILVKIASHHATLTTHLHTPLDPWSGHWLAADLPRGFWVILIPLQF